MTLIKALLQDQVLTLVETPVIAAGGVEEDVVRFDFGIDAAWEGYTKKAVFYRDESDVYHVDIGSDNTAIIPWEVLQQEGFMFLGVFGTKGSEIKTSTVARYRVENGAITIGSESQPTPDIYANIIINLNSLADAIESIKVQTALAPTTVTSVDEMTDTSKEYILASTGTIWRYQETTTTGEVTVQVDGAFTDSARLGSDGSVVTGGSYAAYVTTPFIDLLAYPVPFTLHLDGGTFLPSASDSYTKICSYTEAQAKITCLNAVATLVDTVLNVSDSDVSVDSDGNASILFSKTPKTTNNNNDGVLKYVRFSGKGSSSTASVYATYQGEVTSKNWVDTGVKYVTGSSVAITQMALDKMKSINNEGADPETITLLPSPVLDFYNSEAYPDDDYTVTHLPNTNYPCRADIPVPFTVKWEHNQNAMRTTVAVSRTAIETPKRLTMMFYDATGFDNYPIYNLLPSTTYYYQVTHVLSDGSLVVAKSGSFTTSGETWRLLYIDGTQNVRDLGGWTGLNGKKVKYGKIIRGASLSDTSDRDFVVTGKGRLALGELKVQAELNLGDTSTETSISSTCAYMRLGYSNYAVAITNENARANFKTILEWIVRCLDGTLTVTGLPTIARNIYMHCQGGCDRTGTLSFLLLGLLGVSESDLAKEYELSSFSNVGVSRKRNTTLANNVYDYVGMVEALKTYSGATITDKFVSFATACGISSDTIASFRNLMLE